MLTRIVLKASIIYFLITITNLVSAAEAVPIQILVAESGDVNNIWEYSLDPTLATINLKRHQVQTDTNLSYPDWYVSLFKEHKLLVDSRIQSATLFDKEINNKKRVEWASNSPDCKYAIIGYEHPLFDSMNNASIGKTKPWLAIKEINFKNDYNTIADVAWTDNSDFLVLIESIERSSISPKAILSSFAGHSIPIHTFYANIINVKNGETKRILIAENLKYGEIISFGANSQCDSPKLN